MINTADTGARKRVNLLHQSMHFYIQ